MGEVESEVFEADEEPEEEKGLIASSALEDIFLERRPPVRPVEPGGVARPAGVEVSDLELESWTRVGYGMFAGTALGIESG